MSTSAVESDSIRERSASSEPCPSALMMRLSVFLPSAGICMNVSSETRCDPERRDADVAAADRTFLGGFARDAFVANDH